MGSFFAKCLAEPPPPVVFTICPVDGKGHQFCANPTPQDKCEKCAQTKEQLDLVCQECRHGNHQWQQDYEPVPGAQPAPAQSGVAQAIPVVPIFKCVHCGLRQRVDQAGVAHYDDYYMYGGGHMMGMEMGLMFGIMGASHTAYSDPMYADYYGDEYGGDMGFDADDDDFGGGDF